MFHRLRTAGTAAVAFALLAAGQGLTTGPALAIDGAPSRTSVPSQSRATNSLDASSAIVQLAGAPVALLNVGQTTRLDAKSPKVRAARAQLMAVRNDFKQWLRANAPKARVTSEYDVALHAVSVDLHGTSLETIRLAPGVLAATLQTHYVMLSDPVDPDLALVNAIAGWSSGGAAGAGAAVKVAVIDSGIDQMHPCFDGSGYPAFTGDEGDASLTNSKVVVAKVFNMRAHSRGLGAEPGPGQSHGTHVAGTIACEPLTQATVDSATIPYGVTGVAPAAQLGNYNVFPGDVESARSEDILNALEAAFQDKMDIANMSLGGGASGIQDLLTMAVDNLDRSGMLVAISAGNNGPDTATIGSPGSAQRALTAGAYSVGHFSGIPVILPNRTIATASGDFAVPSSPLTKQLQAVMDSSTLSNTCTARTPGSLTNRIALVSRGGCTFATKIANAKAAGAVAVIVVNNVAGSPTAMGGSGTILQTIAVMAGLLDKADLIAASGESVTIGTARAYQYEQANDSIMQAFSSRGPTDVDFRLKPDVTAPGGNVLSSIPDNGWAFFSGTSMSSPHIAGMAAVVKSQHGHWEAWQIRSALVNTARATGLLSSAGSPTADVLLIGNGAADLARAVAAKVALDPVSVSFGMVPSLNGRSLTKTVALSSLDGSGPFTVSIVGSPVFSVSYTDGVITVSYTPRDGGVGIMSATVTVAENSAAVATFRVFAFNK